MQQVDDLCLNRHIQSGNRLVADDKLRLDGQRAGNADALTLAAGKLVREAVSVFAVQTDGRKQLGYALLTRFASYMLWMIMPSSMIEPTVMRGSSEAYGSWKTICAFLANAKRSFLLERSTGLPS